MLCTHVAYPTFITMRSTGHTRYAPCTIIVHRFDVFEWRLVPAMLESANFTVFLTILITT